MPPSPDDAPVAQKRVPESRALTGIRGVAALWVVVFHLPSPLKESAFGPVLARGYLGVDLFFILSGFVLAYVYRGVLAERPTARETASFYGVRLARIYPLHLAVLGLFVALELAKLAAGEPAFGEGRALGSLVKQLLLVHAWGFEDSLAWNRVAWSISAEWVAYLVFPFTFAVVRKLPALAAAAGAVACLGALFALEQAAGNLDTASRLALARCLPEFHAGMCLAQLAHLGAASRLPKPALELLLWGTLLALPAALLWCPIDAPIVAAFAVLVLGLFESRSALATLLGTTVVHRLGVISYSLYMLQYFVVIVTTRLLRSAGEELPPWVGSLLALLVLVPLAELSFRYIESSARDTLRAAARRLA